MRRPWILCVCAFMAVAALLEGCTGLWPQASAAPTQAAPATATPALLAEPGPTATTPPEQSQQPAATSEPAPTPAALTPRVLNILLLGSDQREGQSDPWRMDVIMWVTIRRDDKAVGILSIPRDLWVSTPRVGENRINVADHFGETLKYPGGGPALAADALKNDLGLHTDRYIRLNFETFERVIDAIGGITVDVDCPIMGIRNRALDVGMIPHIPRIWAALKDSVDTNLSLQEVLSLALLAKDIAPEQIHSRVIDYTMVRDWTTPEGAMVLLPDRAKIQDAIAHLMDSPPLMEASEFPGTCPD